MLAGSGEKNKANPFELAFNNVEMVSPSDSVKILVLHSFSNS